MADKPQWKCPLGEKLVPYGTSCTDYPNCGDILNINGLFYQKLKEKQQKEEKSLVKDFR